MEKGEMPPNNDDPQLDPGDPPGSPLDAAVAEVFEAWINADFPQTGGTAIADGNGDDDATSGGVKTSDSTATAKADGSTPDNNCE